MSDRKQTNKNKPTVNAITQTYKISIRCDSSNEIENYQRECGTSANRMCLLTHIGTKNCERRLHIRIGIDRS